MEVVEYFNLMLIAGWGINILVENILIEKAIFYEGWVIFYFNCFLIAVTHWLGWKKLFFIFFSVKASYVVLTLLINHSVNSFFVVANLLSMVIFPVVWIVVSKIVRNFLELIQENKELIASIKYILQVLPHGIIIQCKDKNIQKHIVKFTNDIAKEKIFTGIDPVDKDLESLDLEFKVVDSELEDIKKEIDAQLGSLSLNELLEIHQRNSENVNVFSSVVDAAPLPNQDNHENTRYWIKTIKLKWVGQSDAYLHVFHDITCLKQYEKEKAINKCLHIMFSSVSHEFRTPLNAFSNAISLLESNIKWITESVMPLWAQNLRKARELRSLSEACQKYVNIGEISSRILLNLVEDILDLAKIEAGKFTLNKEPFVISKLIDEVKFIFGQQCHQKGLYLRVEGHEELLNSRLNSDMSRIRQVLLNLISNSYKFTSEGGIIIKLESYYRQEEENTSTKCIRFSVTDTGIGISKEDKKGLFQMFGVVLKHKEQFNMKGTGLGLTISQKLVNLLGGEISLTSVENRGTEVGK